MSDLVIEVAMLGPRGNELGPRQSVPVAGETANLWQAIGVHGELDRITRVGADVNGLAARIARESQRPLHAMSWGALRWGRRVAGQGVELVVELAPRLRSTLFHDGVEVPGLDVGALRTRKDRRYREYLAPIVCERKGPDVWRRRVSRAIAEILEVWNPTTLYLAVPATSRLPALSALPTRVELVACPDTYEDALLVWDAEP